MATLVFLSRRSGGNGFGCVAGAEGFEPSDAGFKVPSLTAWRRPSVLAGGRSLTKKSHPRLLAGLDSTSKRLSKELFDTNSQAALVIPRSERAVAAAFRVRLFAKIRKKDEPLPDIATAAAPVSRATRRTRRRSEPGMDSPPVRPSRDRFGGGRIGPGRPAVPGCPRAREIRRCVSGVWRRVSPLRIAEKPKPWKRHPRPGPAEGARRAGEFRDGYRRPGPDRGQGRPQESRARRLRATWPRPPDPRGQGPAPTWHRGLAAPWPRCCFRPQALRPWRSVSGF